MGYNTKKKFEKKAKNLEGKKAKLEEMRNCEKNHKREGKEMQRKDGVMLKQYKFTQLTLVSIGR